MKKNLSPTVKLVVLVILGFTPTSKRIQSYCGTTTQTFTHTDMQTNRHPYMQAQRTHTDARTQAHA